MDPSKHVNASSITPDIAQFNVIPMTKVRGFLVSRVTLFRRVVVYPLGRSHDDEFVSFRNTMDLMDG